MTGIIISMDRIGFATVMKGWNRVLSISHQPHHSIWQSYFLFKRYNAKFNYITLNPEDMSAFYETNLFKIRALNGKIFGSIIDSDG
jgi:hypothetical protein